jgi:FtsH-binding integral membrane protein
VKFNQIFASRVAGWIILVALWSQALRVADEAYFEWGKTSILVAHVPPLLLALMFALAICYFAIRVKLMPYWKAAAIPLLPIFVVLICKIELGPI